MLVSGLVGAGCGGSDGSASDAGTARRGQTLLVSTSDGRGVVRVGAKAGELADVLLVDAETQKPIAGALAEAQEEDEGDGYLVRVSKDSAGYRPEVVRCRRGQPHTVTLGSSTTDVRGRAVRVNTRVIQDEFVGEYDLAGVTSAAERELRPEILFVPALDEGAMQPASRFAVYKSRVPQILFAIKTDGTKPTSSGTTTTRVVKGQARVVSTSGARRGQSRVQPVQVAAAGEKRAGEELSAPSVSALSVSAPDANGQGLLTWTVEDPQNRLIAFDVGIDTTQPARRLAKELRSLPFEVRRGDHLACVRPVFAGADVDPVVRCLSFPAPQAPQAPSVRVSVKPMPVAGTNATARRGMPVVVELENDGDVDAPGFSVDVVVSRDGRLEGGLGQVRSVWIDGVKARTKTTRTTDVTPPRDGELFVVARADALRTLDDANPEDNLDRSPLKVMPANGNRAPQVSVAGTAVGGSNAASLVEGESLKLRAAADDHEEGDLSAQITWISSRDGKVGQGPSLDTSLLSPGMHRLRAEVADRGVAARIIDRGESERPNRLGRGGRARLTRGAATAALEMGTAESAVAELELQVLARNAPAGNTPPRLSAGPDLTTTAGGEVVPGATAADADGDQLSFAWTVVTEDGSPVELAGAGELRPRFTPPAAGVYRMSISASDGKASEKDELTVTVLSPASNRAPQVMVDLPGRGAVGTSVSARVQASDEDGDGLTLSYALGRPQGSAALLASAETRIPTFVPDLPGVYSFTVRADDGRGGLATASAAVAVEAASLPPLPDGGLQPVDARPVPDAGVTDEPPRVNDAGIPEAPMNRVDAPSPDVVGAGCDPLNKTSCPTGESCRIRFPGDVTVCTQVGALAAMESCRSDLDCAGGLVCANFMCLPVCDVRRPSCGGELPVCNLPEGNKYYGACYRVNTTPPDGGPVDSMQTAFCDPVIQQGCSRAEDSCHVGASGGFECLLSGTGGEGASCTKPSDCMPGTGCFDFNQQGSKCRRYCDSQAPSCPSTTPFCSVLVRSRYGACMPMPVPTDAGTTVVSGCDPIKQSGCTRTEDACFVFDTGELACLLFGAGVPDQSFCDVHSDCKRGSGCFDGPNGRMCRWYCDLRGASCTNGGVCKQLGPGAYGSCQPGFTADAGPAFQ